MDNKQRVTRDERTEAVENVGLRWGTTFVLFALLFDVCIRGVFFHEAAWDLLFLAAVPGFCILINHARQKTLELNSPQLKVLFVLTILTAVCAAVISAILASHKIL